MRYNWENWGKLLALLVYDNVSWISQKRMDMALRREVSMLSLDRGLFKLVRL